MTVEGLGLSLSFVYLLLLLADRVCFMPRWQTPSRSVPAGPAAGAGDAMTALSEDVGLVEFDCEDGGKHHGANGGRASLTTTSPKIELYTHPSHQSIVR